LKRLKKEDDIKKSLVSWNANEKMIIDKRVKKMKVDIKKK
jgi:hypothetical protein